MSVLAPTVTHMIAAGSGNVAWTEVCSSVGIKLVDASSVQNTSPATPDHDMSHPDHCPFCFTHAGSFGLLPSVHVILPLVLATYPLPTLFYQSSQPLFAWAVAQPRGPPAIS